MAANKQTLAYWRAENRQCDRMAKDPCLVVPANTPHHFDVERRRAFAAGWIAGADWTRRNLKR